jgi:hypothetical protein
MGDHSLVAGLLKYGLASAFVRRVTPDRAFPEAPGVTLPWAQSPELVPTPELPALNLYPPGRYLRQPVCRMPLPCGRVLEGVTWYPPQGVLLDARNRAIEDAHQVPMRTHWFDWRAFFPRQVEDIGGACFVFRSFRQSYYHLLTDHLPALYTLGVLPWEGKERVKLLLPAPMSDAERHFLPAMCPSNVEIVEVAADRSYRLERCYFVSHLAQRGCGYLPRWYLDEFLRRVAPRRPRERKRRIYIARTGNAARRIVNETELIPRLERLGFEAFELEKLPVTQQIELFHDAEIVVAPHGAGLANLLFAENAKVLELFEGPLLRPHYYFVSKARGHAYTALQSRDRRGLIGRKYDEFIESFNGSSRDFSVDCERVVRAVEELLQAPPQSQQTA